MLLHPWTGAVCCHFKDFKMNAMFNENKPKTDFPFLFVTTLPEIPWVSRVDPKYVKCVTYSLGKVSSNYFLAQCPRKTRHNGCPFFRVPIPYTFYAIMPLQTYRKILVCVRKEFTTYRMNLQSIID